MKLVNIGFGSAVSAARILSIVIYAVMGWIVLVAVKPLIAALGTAGFTWLAAGGVLYTVGIIFFALEDRLRREYPGLHLAPSRDELSALTKLAFSEVDAATGPS